MKREYEKQYHEVEDQHWWFVGRRELVRTLAHQFSPERSCPVLEIGCSGGMLMRQLREDGYSHVTGIDISPEAIAQCTKNGVPNAHVMDAQQPRFDPESFNLITASDVLEHLTEPTVALRAWCDLLRPGGVLIVFVPAFMLLWGAHDVANKHQHRYRASELKQQVEAAGFRAERVGYWNCLLFPAVALVRVVRRILPASPRREEYGDLSLPSPFLNRGLARLLQWENRRICHGGTWPFGVSAMVIARKA